LRGYDDALFLAEELGEISAADRIRRARLEFRIHLHESILHAVAAHKIDFVPGSAELGDFDATSTTVALSPGDEQARLRPDLLQNTFDRYWREFTARRNSRTNWETYTPYELRLIGAFTRLGWRDRIPALLEFFLSHRRPAAWNGWAEVVGRDPRKPLFIGDMPHAWIASDCIRSVLDMFAYRRGGDGALVLAAGLPPDWLEGEGVGISGLVTPWGKLSYSLRKEEDVLHLRLDAEGLPPGGFVLPWPYPGKPGDAEIDGRAIPWKKTRELPIESGHADIKIKVPKE
ncbi:MAG TPA: hypothetical protein VLS90_21745, partial [Thermodesulfobacteriota bacterium]|nr:hypothetical protein [Thermodesulfobacteriota bacterium]